MPVAEHSYSNTGFFSFQPRHSFNPVLRFPFSFQTGYSSFCGGLGSWGRSGRAIKAAPGAP